MADTNLERPLISFILVAYNQERFIAEAVQGALSQTYAPLEIILSDDCSTDRTFEIIKDMAAAYKGPHTIVLNRNERNCGLIGHINRLMEAVKGELIVGAAGDDVSLPQRVSVICREYLDRDRQAHSIFSNAIWIDEVGNKMNMLHKRPVPERDLQLEGYASRALPGLVNGCTHAWMRAAFDIFGPLPEDVGAEDTTIPFRSAMLGEIRYIDEPLVLYRRNADRMSEGRMRYSFRRYQQMRLAENARYLAIYRARLQDIARWEHQDNCRTQDFLLVRDVTRRRTENLEREIGLLQTPTWLGKLLALKRVAEGSQYRQASLLAATIVIPVIPLLRFSKLIAYFEYQNMRGRARKTLNFVRNIFSIRSREP